MMIIHFKRQCLKSDQGLTQHCLFDQNQSCCFVKPSDFGFNFGLNYAVFKQYLAQCHLNPLLYSNVTVTQLFLHFFSSVILQKSKFQNSNQ